MRFAAERAREANAAYTGPRAGSEGPPHQWTRLHQASRAGLAGRLGPADRARDLLDAGAHVNALDKVRRTALWYASFNDRAAVVAELLSEPSVVVNSLALGDAEALEASLPVAALKGHTDVVTALLAWPGVDVNDGEQYGYQTALYYASSKGHLAIVSALLACAGVHVNAFESMNGWTPLHIASLHGHTAVVAALLAHPAIDANLATVGGAIDDVEQCIACDAGFTPLHVAASEGHTEVVALLLAKPGVDVNAAYGEALHASEAGETPLRFARQSGREDVVALLAAAGGVE